jgi:hypothetical protein
MSVGAEAKLVTRAANALRTSASTLWKYARGTFFPTAIAERSFWASVEQKGGTITTSIDLELRVRNRTAEELHLVDATLRKPRIGPVLQTMISVRTGDPEGAIAAYATVAVKVLIVVVGAPGQEGPLTAVVRLADSDGHKRRLKVILRDPRHPFWLSRKQPKP